VTGLLRPAGLSLASAFQRLVRGPRIGSTSLAQTLLKIALSGSRFYQGTELWSSARDTTTPARGLRPPRVLLDALRHAFPRERGPPDLSGLCAGCSTLAEDG